MGVMSMRRALMFPAELPNGWVLAQITNPQKITLGGGLANLLQANIPACQYAIGILDRDWSTMPTVDNTVLNFIWSGTPNVNKFFRIRDGEVQYFPMTDTYAAIVEEGSVFTVAYLPKE